MPIITVQRRMAEQGRIRLGQKVPTASGKQRPDKLDRFRFTSPNQGLIEQIASHYGGDAHPWDNAGKREFEVISDARAIPVIVVKGGFSQWHEAWSKAGLQHRCDGEKDAAGTYCNPDDPAHLEAIQKPTTRLSVMLAEIESLGVWRMESKGWNAAAELPSMTELAMHVGDYVPAILSLAERSSIIEGPKGPQTSRFVVPVLDLRVTKSRLVEIANTVAEGIAAPAAPVAQITAGHDRDYTDAVMEATSVDELRMLWRSAGEHDALTPALEKLITQRVGELNPQTPEAGDAPADPPFVEQPGSAPPASGPATGDVDAAWMQLQVAAGKAGVGDSNLRALLEQEYAQPVEDLDAQQLLDFIGKVAAA